jgi:RNA polymerase sigma-70 factor, ECF subfamily
MERSKQELRWVLLAQAGDREAFDRLLQRIQEPLYRYIAGLVGAGPLAEDILQEVFLLIYRKLRWLREPELFRPWAYRIATREAFRHLKRERRWAETRVDESALADLPAPPRDAFPEKWRAELPRLVSQVSPASRAVIVLHYLNDMPLADVADVLGVALGTVKSRLAYGLDCLRKQLAQ